MLLDFNISQCLQIRGSFTVKVVGEFSHIYVVLTVTFLEIRIQAIKKPNHLI